MQRFEDNNHLIFHLNSRDTFKNQFNSIRSKKTAINRPFKHAISYAELNYYGGIYGDNKSPK